MHKYDFKCNCSPRLPSAIQYLLPKIFSSKQSETSQSARSTPVKKQARLVSYIDPDEEDDIDRTINDEDNDNNDDESKHMTDKMEKDSCKFNISQILDQFYYYSTHPLCKTLFPIFAVPRPFLIYLCNNWFSEH